MESILMETNLRIIHSPIPASVGIPKLEPITGFAVEQERRLFTLQIRHEDSKIQEDIFDGVVQKLRIRQISNPPPRIMLQTYVDNVITLEVSFPIDIKWTFSLASCLKSLKFLKFGSNAFDEYVRYDPTEFRYPLNHCQMLEELVIHSNPMRFRKESGNNRNMKYSRLIAIVNVVLYYSAKYCKNLVSADFCLPINTKLDEFLIQMPQVKNNGLMNVDYGNDVVSFKTFNNLPPKPVAIQKVVSPHPQQDTYKNPTQVQNWISDCSRAVDDGIGTGTVKVKSPSQSPVLTGFNEFDIDQAAVAAKAIGVPNSPMGSPCKRPAPSDSHDIGRDSDSMKHSGSKKQCGVIFPRFQEPSEKEVTREHEEKLMKKQKQSIIYPLFEDENENKGDFSGAGKGFVEETTLSDASKETGIWEDTDDGEVVILGDEESTTSEPLLEDFLQSPMKEKIGQKQDEVEEMDDDSDLIIVEDDLVEIPMPKEPGPPPLPKQVSRSQERRQQQQPPPPPSEEAVLEYLKQNPTELDAMYNNASQVFNDPKVHQKFLKLKYQLNQSPVFENPDTDKKESPSSSGGTTCISTATSTVTISEPAEEGPDQFSSWFTRRPKKRKGNEATTDTKGA